MNIYFTSILYYYNNQAIKKNEHLNILHIVYKNILYG